MSGVPTDADAAAATSSSSSAGVTAGQLINVRLFVESMRMLLDEKTLPSLKDLRKRIGVSKANRLANACNRSTLRIHKTTSTRDDVTLQNRMSRSSLILIKEYEASEGKRKQRTATAAASNDTSSKSTLYVDGRVPSKYPVSIPMSMGYHDNVAHNSNNVLVPGSTAVLKINIYSQSNGRLSRTLLVLGSQSLVTLFNTIQCLNELCESVPDPLSLSSTEETMRHMHETKECSVISSSRSTGFLFIENTFYVRNTDISAMDYSTMITQWVNDPAHRRWTQPHLGLYSRSPMESVNFEDLTLCMQAPYLFSHNCFCEHLFTIEEVRLLHQNDDLIGQHYPITVFGVKPDNRRCRVCDEYPARYRTENDQWAKESPSYFCTHCYEPLHFRPNGEALPNLSSFSVAVLALPGLPGGPPIAQLPITLPKTNRTVDFDVYSLEAADEQRCSSNERNDDQSNIITTCARDNNESVLRINTCAKDESELLRDYDDDIPLLIPSS